MYEPYAYDFDADFSDIRNPDHDGLSTAELIAKMNESLAELKEESK